MLNLPIFKDFKKSKTFCSAYSIVISDFKHFSVNPDSPWCFLHHSPILSKIVLSVFIINSGPSNYYFKLPSVTITAISNIVSFSTSKPDISKSTHTMGSYILIFY